MTAYPNMTREERGAEYTRVRQEFELWKAKGLKLNMARGKPGKQQLDLVSDIFSLMQDPQDYVSDGLHPWPAPQSPALVQGREHQMALPCSWL